MKTDPILALVAVATMVATSGLMACAGGEFTVIDDDASSGDASFDAPPPRDPADVADASAEAAADTAALGTTDASTEASVDASVINSGDCFPGECGADRCVELTPGGYRTCVGTVVEATRCSVPPGSCCASSACRTDGGQLGKCVAGPVAPACGPTTVASNVCAYDGCKTHEDCAALGPKAICAPATAFGRKAASCLPAGCRLDSDCREEPGGACVTVSDPCCGARQVAGLYCVYRGGCRENSQCAPSGYCAIANGRGRCMAGAPTCGLTP